MIKENVLKGIMYNKEVQQQDTTTRYNNKMNRQEINRQEMNRQEMNNAR